YAHWEYAEAPSRLRLMSAAGMECAGQRVLDDGCGVGGKSVAFRERGLEVVGLDLSPENVRAGSGFARKRRTHVDFMAADATAIPVRSGSFDVVISTDTFE